MSWEFSLQLFRAIAVAAGPQLCSILVPAIASQVRILYAEQFEILLPVGALFRERRLAEASFHPDRSSGFVHARLAHVVQIFIAGDGAPPERTVVDRADERTFLARFQLCFNEIPHV